jgi:hypothetical protein
MCLEELQAVKTSTLTETINTNVDNLGRMANNNNRFQS